MVTVKVVFRHLNEHNFVLRYPCCESFIDRSLCLKCVPVSAGEVDGEMFCDYNASGDRKLLPYLLYVGRYTRNVHLREMPVCQIDLGEAQRIIGMILNHRYYGIDVVDTKGKSHSVDLYGAHRVLNILSYYVSTARASFTVPLSPFCIIQHLRWDIKNRAQEMYDTTHALRCRTKSGRKRIWRRRSRDSDLSELTHLIYNILCKGYHLYYDIYGEEVERTIQIVRALE